MFIMATKLKIFEDIAYFPVHVPGRGVITTKQRAKGEFLLCYNGEVVCADEGERREEKDGGSGYRFFFKAKGQNLW